MGEARWIVGWARFLCPRELSKINFNIVGGSPTASHFLLPRQKKVTQEKATPMRRPFGIPCVARRSGFLINSHDPLRVHVLKHIRQNSPDQSPLLGVAQGKVKRNSKSKAFVCGRKAPTYSSNDSVGTRAHPTISPPPFEGGLIFPCAPPRYFANKRRFRRALSELRGRARFVCPARASCAAPLVCEISREPRRGGKPGAPSFGYFSWQDKKSDLPPGNPRQSYL